MSLVLMAGAMTLAISGVAYAAFPQDPPSDPNYDPAEEGGPTTCLSTTVEADQHYLYDFMPMCGVVASDPEGAAGMSANRAWKDYTAGNGQTVIAYIEGGINWRNDPEELRKRVFLNAGELPDPTHADGDPGTLNVDDYTTFGPGAGTATADTNGNGVVDPEDVIVRFSDGNDDDGNGYTDDISGWDFYNNQNDPASVDSTYNHTNNQMEQAAAETNNAQGDAGICPKCMLLPIKAGAEALDRTDDLAEAWLFAADAGADVVVSVTADLGYSSFMNQAVENLWDRGVVMVEASNDFNSTDHQGGMFHPHVLPGNGLVNNAAGTNTAPGGITNALTLTYRARASYPEWGTHNMFVAATNGGTTSEATPSVGAPLALVIAYGKEAGLPGGPLSGPEAIQVVRATSSDITGNPAAPLPGWEGKPGFDIQYGYGRPNIWKAMKSMEDGEIPPVAWIDSPDWYSLYDPTKNSTVPVTGHVEAKRTPGAYNWKLEFAPGAEPTDGQFTTANQGTGSAPQDVTGSVDLSTLPDSFWQKAFELSQTKELETNEHYTVTLRLKVTDADGRVGEERRTIAVQRDDTWVDGFPKKIGHGGESQPVLADLQGTGELAVIFGDSDGEVHAVDSAGDELPGFPVLTNETQVEKSHAGIDPGHEPIIPSVGVGDLDHDGKQWIVATSSSGTVYVWDSEGNRRQGWTAGKPLDAELETPGIPRPDMPFTRQPVRGATAPPVLVDMNSDKTLEVVQAGWDGHIHVFGGDGDELDGWPLKPDKPPTTDLVVINDQKIAVPPAVAQLDGDPEPELIVRTQYNETPGAGLKLAFVDGGPPRSHLHAFNEDGSAVPGWPNSFNALVMYYGSAQEFITEGSNAPVTADVNGDGKTEVSAAPGIFSPTYLFKPDGTQETPGIYGPVPNAVTDFAAALVNGTLPIDQLLDVLQGDIPTDAPVNFTTSGAFGKFGPGNQLAYAEPGSGAASVAGSLLLAGSGIPINSYLRAHEAQSGAPIPGFPSKTQGLDFLGAPVIADVTGDGQAEVIEAGDSSAMHAFSTGGGQAAGFPKFTTGWVLFGPAVGDLDSDGGSELVTLTREGYLMAWETGGTAEGNNEWWNYRHDERNTAQYGVDTRPPGILRDRVLSADKSTLTFTAPGDEWYAGTATSYEVVESDNPITSTNFASADPVAGAPAPQAAGQDETYTLPGGGKRYLAMRGVDEAGNVGPAIFVDRQTGVVTPPPPGGGGGTGTTSSGQMRLKVKPKKATAGKRRRFKVTVSSADANCIAGVTVRLGKKTGITNASGRVKIRKRYAGTGKKPVRAAKTGCGTASARIKVKR